MPTDSDTLLAEFTKIESRYENFGKVMNSLIQSLMNLSEIDTHSIHHRVKDKKSLKNKINKKNKYNSINEITDILGLRIITYYSTDVDSVERVIRENFIIDEINTIDKRKTYEPDRFGYMSLHYVVSLNTDRCSLVEYSSFRDMKFEIQIRTILQHTWAEIEHDLGYKNKNSVPDHIRRKFSILSGTLELVDSAFIDIKEALTTYSNELEGGIKENSPNLKNNNTRIDDIFLKSFVSSYSIFNDRYQNYIVGFDDESMMDGVLYPELVTCDEDVSYSGFIDILKKMKITSQGEFINLIENLLNNDEIIGYLDSFRLDWVGEQPFSRYFYLLMLVYAYIATKRKNAVLSEDNESFYNVIRLFREHIAKKNKK